MRRSSIASIVVLGALALGIAVRGASQRAKDKSEAQPAASAADGRTKAFTWFGDLGFPDAKGRKFVRVATGRWHSSGNDQPRNTYIRGFLLKEEGEEFTVLTLSLTTETFRKTPAKTPSHEEVCYEASDLATGAAAYLKGLRAQPRLEERDAMPLWESHPHRIEMFVLAWACWRNGLDKLATELYDYAGKMPTGYRYNADQPPTQSLQKLIADDVAHTEMWRGIVAFEDSKVPRTELLKRFERIVKNYPDTEHQQRAKDTVALLQRMVKEDAEHATKKGGKAFEKLSKKEQIAELIFQLRDQNGHQYSQPGHCDIFDRFGDKEDTPAHRLVKLGYDAVPQLIEAIEDQRFSRSVGYHRNFYFSHYVLRVGDCALAVLERIAARRFWTSSSTFSYMTMDKQAAETKKKAQAWYNEFQQKGEKRMLIEAVERGDQDSYEQANLLLERYPDEALRALKAGLKAAKESWSRDLLVAAAAKIKGDSPLPLLLAEVKEGPFAHGRLVAAKSLHERGRPEGVKAMIAEWQGQGPKRKPQPGVKSEESEGLGDGLASIAEFLATCGKIEAISTLAKDLRKRPVDLRLAVVSSFGESGNISIISTRGGGSLQPGLNRAADNPKEVRAAVEHLLITALDDTEERTGMSGSWNGKSFTDPRICDAAGHILNRLAPEKYPFDLAAPSAKRDRAIVELKNVWRKAHGLTLLPVPEG